MEFFVFDDVNNTLRINEYPILLIKEFKALWDKNRNKCKEDKYASKKIELETKNLEQKCDKFKALIGQFNSKFNPMLKEEE